MEQIRGIIEAELSEKLFSTIINVISLGIIVWQWFYFYNCFSI